MRLYLFVFVSLLSLLTLNAYSQDLKTDNSDKLVVLWTSDNPELARTMVFMYTHNAKRNNWFSEVTLIIWGPSAKLAAENEEIQKQIAQMKVSGVKIEACISCAQMYGVVDKLRQLGVDVKGMGVPLTGYLKQNYKVLSL
jgi:hypothetical protein